MISEGWQCCTVWGNITVCGHMPKTHYSRAIRMWWVGPSSTVSCQECHAPASDTPCIGTSSLRELEPSETENEFGMDLGLQRQALSAVDTPRHLQTTSASHTSPEGGRREWGSRRGELVRVEDLIRERDLLRERVLIWKCGI